MDSDHWANAILTEQLVGTLIKEGLNNELEPYLAQSWSSSSDEKTWRFKLKPGLKTEDGQEITSQAYRECLVKLFRLYLKQGDLPTFSKLKGYDSFKAGKSDLDGISATEKGELVFEFLSRPSGVLEFLSSPYFGFYSTADFEDGHWRDRTRIHSTGSYSLLSFTDKSVVLKKRVNFAQGSASAPDIVEMSFKNANDAMRENTSNSIIALKNQILVPSSNFYSSQTQRSVLAAFILSPTTAPFNDPKVRQAFKSVVRKLVRDQESSEGFPEVPSNYFFETFASYHADVTPNEAELKSALNILRNKKKANLKLFTKLFTEKDRSGYHAKIVDEFEKLTGWQFDIWTPDRVGKDWVERIKRNNEFALRTVSVEAGGTPENYNIEMMFCSILGIAIPDPGSRVCDIVKDFTNGKISSKSDYDKQLDKAIDDESVAIPIGHTGYHWLISRTFKHKIISRTLSVPRFDLMEM